MTDLIVTTEQGKVRGKTCVDYHGGTFYSFSGIPYARAPIGPLRFKAPQPAEPYEGLRDGTKDSYECPSLDMYFGYHVGYEDNCLNLNIYTKELPNETTKKKPVMVWIHGGGFLYGSNRSDHFGPNYLMTEDIILVAINYRLGILGFLSLKDKSLNVPGNAGLKDQVMALKWVQKNISSFGGDPNNVTIFGESAGSASVHYLTLSPTTKGLFHKAILQSGCSLNLWTRGNSNALEVARVMGYKETDEKAIFERLCKENARSIVSGQFKVKDTFMADLQRPLGPVVEYESEDAFLTEEPIEILKSGRQHQVPLIMGYNSLEGLFYEVIRRTRSEATLRKDCECEIPYEFKIPKGSQKSKELAERIQKYYYGDEEVSESNIMKRYKMVGDVEFVYGIQKAMRTASLTSSAPIYAYKMALDGPLNFFKRFCQVKYFKTLIAISLLTRLTGNNSMKSLCDAISNKLPKNQYPGVAHADDLFYLFNVFFTPKIVVGSQEDKYVQRFVKLWTNFAKFGNPTPEIDENLDGAIWNPISKGKVDSIFVIDKKLGMSENEEKERVEFWDKIYNEYGSHN